MSSGDGSTDTYGKREGKGEGNGEVWGGKRRSERRDEVVWCGVVVMVCVAVFTILRGA